VYLGVGQTFDLRNIKVGVVVRALVFSLSIITHGGRAGLEMRCGGLNCEAPSTELELTVWIRIGATPVFWNLVLKPLRIASVPFEVVSISL